MMYGGERSDLLSDSATAAPRPIRERENIDFSHIRTLQPRPLGHGVLQTRVVKTAAPAMPDLKLGRSPPLADSSRFRDRYLFLKQL